MYSFTLLLSILLVTQRPAPVGPHRPVRPSPTDFETLVGAERNFAAASRATGVKAAFLTYLADNALLYRKGRFVNGLAFYQQSPPPGGVLDWFPRYADVSARGDLGFTLGPYTFRPEAGPMGFGTYLTTWRKNAAGQWKVWADFGLNHPQEPGVDQPLPAPAPAKLPRHPADTTQLRTELAAVEQGFAELAASQSLQAAYASIITHPQLRLLRHGAAPNTGLSVQELVAHSPVQVKFEALKTIVSASGDLGTTIGVMQVNGRPGPYQRIWRRTGPGEAWQLQLEYLNVRLQ